MGAPVKLLLRRDQKAGMMGLGKISFILNVRAELTDDEVANIKKYRLGDTMLYERVPMLDQGTRLLGMASRLVNRMVNVTVSVNDLADGKKIECKDIVEMVAVEQQIKEAAQTFKEVLETAARFGGEEVLEIA
jgi:F420-0:gamma-glutamyl ligase-like protein